MSEDESTPVVPPAPPMKPCKRQRVKKALLRPICSKLTYSLILIGGQMPTAQASQACDQHECEDGHKGLLIQF